MVPRVFVSSTYYDLKHVRERLEKFINDYGFEPVLFESDKVTYEYGQPIDQSAYYEVGLCHIMVLIIGGRYGSPSSTPLQEAEINKYNEGYISITRRELETALKLNIPIIIFIDKNVYAEYQTYKENKEIFEDEAFTEKLNSIKRFKFAHVDDVNVFRFIDSVNTIACKTFDKVEEVESYLKYQFAGYFYLYLESLKKNKTENQILDNVNELNNLVLRMNEMVDSVGKKILGNSDFEYQMVIQKQFQIVLDFFGEKIYDDFDFNVESLSDEVHSKINFKLIAEIFCRNIFWGGYNFEYDTKKKHEENMKVRAESITKVITNINAEISQIYKEYYPAIGLSRCNVYEIYNSYMRKVAPLLIDDTFKYQFLEKIEKVISFKLDSLPF